MALAFNSAFYLTANPDVAAAVAAGTFASGQAHWLKFGQVEGRDPNAFLDVSFYLAKYADIQAALTATVTGGAANGTFSVLDHFNNFGSRPSEGRDPNSSFDTSFYYGNSPDVAAAAALGQTDAITHWNTFGRFEAGRVASNTTGNLLVGVASGAAEIQVGTSVPTAVPGQTFSLTTAANLFTGTTANDTVTGNAGTLSSIDEVDLKEGLDRIEARMDNTAVAAPIIRNTEDIHIIARPVGTAGGAALSFVDITGFTAVTLEGNADFTFANAPDTFNLIVASGFGCALFVGVADTAGTDVLNLRQSNASAFSIVDTAAGFNTLNINATSAQAAVGFDMNAVTLINVLGSGTVTLDLDTALRTAGTTAIGGLTSLTGIAATALAGAFNLDLGFAGNINIEGSTGNDSFNLNSTISTLDVIIGGQGNDSASGRIAASGLVRPTIGGVESLAIDFGTGATFDIRNVSGMTVLNVMYEDTAVIDQIGREVSTLNIAQDTGVAVKLDLNYVAATTSNVVLNIGAPATNASGFSAGTIAYSSNAGGVTINSVGPKANFFQEFDASTITTLTINANCAALTLGSQVSANNVKTFAINATAADFRASAILVHTAQTITLNQAVGGSGIDIFGIDAGSGTLTINAAGSGGVTLGNYSALSAASIDITTTNSATVTIGSASLAGTGANPLFNLIAGSGTTLTIGSINPGGVTAGSAQFRFLVSGEGDVRLGATTAAVGGIFSTANLGTAVLIDAVSHGGSFFLNATAGIAGASAAFGFTAGGQTYSLSLGKGGTASANFVILGNGNDEVVGGSAVDRIVGAGGDDRMQGGQGNDVYLFISSGLATAGGGGANADQSTAGAGDTIIGFGAGDTILFSGISALTSVAGAAFTAATAGGTIRVATASLTAIAGLATATYLAIFQSGTNTIIQIGFATGTAGSAGSSIVQIALDSFSVTASTTGLTISLGANGLTIAGV